MPELPEVETVRAALEKSLKGRRIVCADIRRAGLRTPFPKTLKKDLENRRFAAFRRRAKYIIADFEDNASPSLVIHLGMSGRVQLPARGTGYKPQKHDHVILEMDDGSLFVFNDARRFGMIFLVPHDCPETHNAFADMGPEPLEKDFTGDVLHAALAKKSCCIKAALMDQRVVAGLGNIYVCEALFSAGISPLRAAGRVTKNESGTLVREIKKVLRAAIKSGGSTLRDYRRTDGTTGYFQHRFSVYDRENESCPGCHCDKARTGGVRRIVQQGRSTFFCPRKQV